MTVSLLSGLRNPTERERVPINIAPAARDRLSRLLYQPEFRGTGYGYSAFIDRACEAAETEIAELRRESDGREWDTLTADERLALTELPPRPLSWPASVDEILLRVRQRGTNQNNRFGERRLRTALRSLANKNLAVPSQGGRMWNIHQEGIDLMNRAGIYEGRRARA